MGILLYLLAEFPAFGLRPGSSSSVPVQGERASGKRPESTLKSFPSLLKCDLAKVQAYAPVL